MGYIESNLMQDERVLHRGDIHWFVFVPSGFVFFLGCLFFINKDIAILGALLLPISLVLFVKAFLFKISTEVAVTSKRVIAKRGFIRRNTVELNHRKVESLNVDQGIAGRIFCFGTIQVNGTGGGRTPIPNISNPLAFRRGAMQTIDNTQDTPQNNPTDKTKELPPQQKPPEEHDDQPKVYVIK